MNKVKSPLSRLNDLPRRWKAVLCAVLILAMTGLQWLQLDMSCGTRIVHLLTRHIVYIIIDLALVSLLDLLFLLFTRRWHIAYILGSVFYGLWSIVNHYVYLFSGDVLTVTSLRSAQTAFAVLPNYSLTLDMQVVLILAGTAFNVFLAILLKKLAPDPIPWRRLWAVILCLAILGVGSDVSLTQLWKVDKAEWWNTQNIIYPFGYPVLFLRQAERARDPYQVPEGYDTNVLDPLAADAQQASAPSKNELPDIILILNETFSFPDDFTETNADVPYNENWLSLENAIKGRAVVPNIGGGTNNCEYELLTGNSMYLLHCWAPFMLIDMSTAPNVDTYLESFGYSSCAMHSFLPSSYDRGRVYPTLGFDETHFYEDFTQDQFGGRIWTDDFNYRDLFRWYEDKGDGPRFMYLLTFQNHGGWEKNDPSWDTVHTGSNFGDLTDDMDEFLSCIDKSDEALVTLTDYFNSVDRPVIVCMLGDHVPSLVNQLPRRSDIAEKDWDIVARSTPFFIWANDAFGPIEEKDDMLVSVPDLVPMVLDMAGIPLSPYYRTILDISERIPARLSTGMYRAADGEYGTFSQDDANYELLAPYYFMEYNSFQKPAERYQVLFDPPVGDE